MIQLMILIVLKKVLYNILLTDALPACHWQVGRVLINV